MGGLFDDLRKVGVSILTIGQYLRPSMQHLPLERYYHPDEFAEMNSEFRLPFWIWLFTCIMV